MSGATASSPAAGPERCRNCGAEVPGRFCGTCGQERARDLHVPFRRLAGEAIAEAFTLDSRLGRTLGPLLLRPGEVTRAYLDGRRARYTSPVKLYLVLSFLFFAVSALRASETLQIRVSGVDTATSPAAQAPPQLDELRALGEVGERVAERIERLLQAPPEEARRRFSAAFVENLPTAMFILLPLVALLLRVFYRRTRLYFAEHAVFALHAHSVAYLLLLPGVALASNGLRAAGFLAACAHFTLAARHVYRRGWRSTLARSAGVLALYVVLLGHALVAVTILALLRV
jgi:hypothetical protein